MPLVKFTRARSMVGALFASAAFGALAGASGAAALNEPADKQRAAANGSIPATAPAVARQFGTLADMVEAVGPAVVQIQVSPRTAGSAGQTGAFGELFGNQGDNPPRSGAGALGSGFVIDPSGIIVTNNHVVASGGEVTVKFVDGKELAGTVVGRDQKTDLAVIKVNASRPLDAARWGDSDAARVGENVFAVGSPFGLGNSVTSGIISARGREIGAGPYDDFLQVDASINTGNSGGPLFDASGRVVGVNTAIFSPSGGNVGIGFAIPSRLAQSVVDQIVNHGEVRRGRVGVLLQPLSRDVVEGLRLPDMRGALIADVDPNGPAAAGGIRRGDVVISFADQAIDDSRQFARAVAGAKIGSRPKLVVIREGRKIPVVVDIAGPEAA